MGRVCAPKVQDRLGALREGRQSEEQQLLLTGLAVSWWEPDGWVTRLLVLELALLLSRTDELQSSGSFKGPNACSQGSIYALMLQAKFLKLEIKWFCFCSNENRNNDPVQNVA